jgi:D-tyrosyl-tRNA(Tyr) deacylase
MRVVIQRASEASVTINNKIHAAIGRGFMILVGIETTDSTEDAEWLAGKVAGLRIFDDENGVMNRSVTDIRGELLVISQFTLHALTKKGNRPSYIRAAGHEKAIPLYENFCKLLSEKNGNTGKNRYFCGRYEGSID